MTLGLPVFAFAQIALTEEVAAVPGAEIIAERRGFFPAMSKDRSDGKDYSEDEDKGANQQLGIGKVVHRVSFALDVRSTQRGIAAAAAKSRAV
ncbi:MAG: hypothetical protein ABSG60_05745 [Terracidiphilus sp.]